MTTKEVLDHLHKHPECDVYIQVNVGHQIHYEWMSRNTYLNLLSATPPNSMLTVYVDASDDLIVQ